MAKPPTESSGPSSSGQSDLSQSVREAAASTLNQARQAIDQYMREANRRYGAMESSVEAAQSGRREINRNAIDFAEKNVHATAQELIASHRAPGWVWSLERSRFGNTPQQRV
jgi:hypothetical protein